MVDGGGGCGGDGDGDGVTGGNDEIEDGIVVLLMKTMIVVVVG